MSDHAALSADQSPVVISGSRDADIAIAVICAPLLLLFVLPVLDVRPDLFKVLDPFQDALMVGVLIWLMGPAIWRLRDRSPVLVADETGIVLHPSRARGPLLWADVQSISVETPKTGRSIDFVRIRLWRRIWALAYPLGTECLEFPLPLLGLGRGHADDLVRQLQRLKSVADAGRHQVS